MATPDAWKTEDLPARRTSVPLDRAFSREEMERIRHGVVPEEMEDKWFIYWRDDALFFHRSWTGYCIYVVRFVPDGEIWRMTRADVNRDRRQYSEKDDEKDARLISYLIDVLLLHRQAEWPPTGLPAEESALANWSSVGRAMTGRHPGDGDVGFRVVADGAKAMMVFLCGELKLPWSWSDTKSRLTKRLRSAGTLGWNAFVETHGLAVHGAGIYRMDVAERTTGVKLQRVFEVWAFDGELGDAFVAASGERVFARARRYARETPHGVCVAFDGRIVLVWPDGEETAVTSAACNHPEHARHDGKEQPYDNDGGAVTLHGMSSLCWVRVNVTCTRCGATRSEDRNGWRVEASPWVSPRGEQGRK